VLVTPPPQPLFPPALTAYFKPVPHHPELRALTLSMNCLNAGAGTFGSVVYAAQVASVRVIIRSENAWLRRGVFGFRTAADSCSQRQLDRALRHANDTLRLHGLG
jgi:hypothetical protein